MLRLSVYEPVGRSTVIVLRANQAAPHVATSVVHGVAQRRLPMAE